LHEDQGPHPAALGSRISGAEASQEHEDAECLHHSSEEHKEMAQTKPGTIVKSLLIQSLGLCKYNC
jgi:hypothetical protein